MTDDLKHPDDFADDVAWLRDTAKAFTDLTAELHTLSEDQLTDLQIETARVESRLALLAERIKNHRDLRRRKEKGFVSC